MDRTRCLHERPRRREGFVLFELPLKKGDRDVLLIVTAGSEAEVRGRLAADPWQRTGMLTTTAIEGWTILLSPAALDPLILERIGTAGGGDKSPTAEAV